jgi:Plasmid pRiA4b ORF-3-like protein
MPKNRKHVYVHQDDFKQLYIIRAKLLHRKRVYRDLLVSGENMLDELAGLILNSFNFDCDHCFGFYSDFKRYYDSKEAYELFVDLAEEENDLYGGAVDGAKKVGTTTVRSVFTPKKKMLFIFDYGDQWEFEIECLKQEVQNEAITKLEIIKKNGDSPKQYPDFDEDGNIIEDYDN